MISGSFKVEIFTHNKTGVPHKLVNQQANNSTLNRPVSDEE